MKLSEIANVSDDSNMVATLKKHCGEYISIIKHDLAKPLYRGFRNTHSDMSIIEPRVDRKPKDTSWAIHNTLNEYFKQRFGYPYRNGIFAVSDGYTANNYGATHVIFPIGALHYIWSPHIADIFEFIDDLTSNDFTDDQVMRRIERELPWYINKNLSDAIELEHEVMLANKCYVLTYPTYQRISTLL